MRPSITVITPSLSQVEYLPACLASVANQTYPAAQHLVLDPGSIDGSRELVASFTGATLIAESDEGQSDAVGRGMRQATGDVVAWLNADDQFADDQVLAAVADRFAETDAPDVVYGRGRYVEPTGTVIADAAVQSDPDRLGSTFVRGVGILQPATFIHQRVISKIGVPDPSLRFAMDYEYWMRAWDAGCRFVHLPVVLALATVHPDAKTVSERGASLAEAAAVATRRNGFLSDVWALRLADHELTGADGMFTMTRPSDGAYAAVAKRSRAILWETNRNPAALRSLMLTRWERQRLKTIAAMVGWRRRK